MTPKTSQVSVSCEVSRKASISTQMKALSLSLAPNLAGIYFLRGFTKSD